MRRLLTALVLVAVALALGCQREPRVHQDTILAFGTLIEVSIADTSAERADAAFAELRQAFRKMHREWHAWEPGALGRVNSLIPTGEYFPAEPRVIDLIQAAQPLSRASDGLFDPAVGRLVALWGFHSETPASAPQPDPGEIETLVAADPRMSDLEIDGNRLRSANPTVMLDFGAFGKGYGIDIAMGILRERGIRNAVINAGGDLRAIGQRGDRAWRVGIRDPFAEGVLAGVSVKGDESVFTSGNYERDYERDGKRIHHIIDPRTGYPARGTASATVIAQDAATADAAATALFIAGPGDWPRIARQMGIEAVLIVTEDGELQASPAMARRLQFPGDAPPMEVLPLNQKAAR